MNDHELPDFGVLPKCVYQRSVFGDVVLAETLIALPTDTRNQRDGFADLQRVTVEARGPQLAFDRYERHVSAIENAKIRTDDSRTPCGIRIALPAETSLRSARKHHHPAGFHVGSSTDQRSLVVQQPRRNAAG